MTQGRMAKAVYMAPTKVFLQSVVEYWTHYCQALCSQKAREWEKKFQPLGIKCSWVQDDHAVSSLISVYRYRVDR